MTAIQDSTVTGSRQLVVFSLAGEQYALPIASVIEIIRHTKPRSVKDTQKAQSSGIIDQEGPIDVSNVMLLDPTDNKPTRVGVRKTDGGIRERYSKRTGKAVE